MTEEKIELTCQHCAADFTYYIHWKRNRKYCTACFSRFKRRKLKQKAVDFMGGKCTDCGYNKCLSALQFHHTSPTEKDFHFSEKISKSWKEVEEELKKCILLCANCHAEKHYEITRRKYDLLKLSSGTS